MLEPSAATERNRLTGSAYRTGRDLAARQALYRWQTPRHDLPGLVAERLTAVRGTVVDVGCGNGTFVARIRRDRPDLMVLGLDLSAGILAEVPAPVAVADAARLPLTTGSAGAALAMHMLYHVPDIPAAVRELSRVVAPGAPVIASTNSEHDKAELDDLWGRALTDVLGTAPATPRPAFATRFSLENAPALLGAEFGTVETVPLPGVIELPDPSPVAAYLASYRAWADEYGAPFEETVERARRIAAAEIARNGTFRVNSRAGLLICRR
ncbi:class I SAM-dependent methyltransferase [Streptomyces sp. NPDC005820]|uniref:class I SAM-dependent methyltransferase n=1 Tax=Streptomyces sp. NPDC005820 TaxID=3157069 RepID=UPI0033CA8359